MPVIAHNAVAAHTHPEPFDAFGQNLLKRQKITVFAKHPQSAVRTVQHMIGMAAKGYAFYSRHAKKLRQQKAFVNR
jgi:hypothetical protein